MTTIQITTISDLERAVNVPAPREPEVDGLADAIADSVRYLVECGQLVA